MFGVGPQKVLASRPITHRNSRRTSLVCASLIPQAEFGISQFSFGVQTLAAGVFVPQQNERYFDLLGSIGFLSSTAFSLYFPTLRSRLAGNYVPIPRITSFHPRSVILSALTALWAGRLGSFLFMRIKVRSGSACHCSG